MEALDLFAGTGWGVACRWLGIEEYGVDNDPAVIATRERNQMTTIYPDVWEGIDQDDFVFRDYSLLIASPPCQTFSAAGNGKGRRALAEVVQLIREEAYARPLDMRAFAETHGDPRTALVLTPLTYALRDLPRYIVLEQVRSVLPVWAAAATVLRQAGYSVWVGILHAEQYGVPQTRTRAVLIARRDGKPAGPPSPTHSKFYVHDTSRIDPGLKPWVSMADALGWSGFSAEKVMGRGMVERYGERPGRMDSHPAFTIRASAGGMEPGGFILRSNYGTSGDPENRGERRLDQPAPTITGKANRNKWTTSGTESDRPWRRLEVHEAATLQTYPADFQWVGGINSNMQQIGNAVPPLLAEVILKEFL